MEYILNEDDIKYIKSKKEKPSYWSVLPATVRYSKNLKPAEKLLYSEITALSNKNGYCHAKNNYFAELYSVDKSTVSRWISNLQKNDFLKIVIIRDDKKQVVERKIYPEYNTPIDEKINTPIDNLINTPIDEKVKENNTSINKIKNNNIEELHFYFKSLKEFREYLFSIELHKLPKINTHLKRIPTLAEKHKHLEAAFYPEYARQNWQKKYKDAKHFRNHLQQQYEYRIEQIKTQAA